MAAKQGFDAERILKLFKECCGEGDVISIDSYVNAYEELSKIFPLFGTVFGFVNSDVEEKIGILRDYRKSAESEKYASVQSMLNYEVENNITINKKKASGSRTLLRLHRALEFIAAMLTKIKETDNSKKFSNEAQKAYDATLAKHHPWLVKKGVGIAMMTLPSRSDLLKKLNLDDTPARMGQLGELVEELNKIYDITQKLYEKDNLLDLP